VSAAATPAPGTPNDEQLAAGFNADQSQQGGPASASASAPVSRSVVISNHQLEQGEELPPMEYEKRTFPEGVPVHPTFPLLYRKFPLCGYLDPAVERYVGSNEHVGLFPFAHKHCFNTQ
jgi:hypothetical protein